MTTEIVTRWVNRYVDAWESNDPDAIGALFTDDARYQTAPFREPWVGRDAIVSGWLGRQDRPGTWSFTFTVLGLSDDRAFVQGQTRYLSPAAEYANLWVIRLTPEGTCAEFTEWFMPVPTESATSS